MAATHADSRKDACLPSSENGFHCSFALITPTAIKSPSAAQHSRMHHLLWAFATLNHQAPEPCSTCQTAHACTLLTAHATSTTSNHHLSLIPMIHTQGLENLLWAFATLNHRPPPDMLQLAAQRLAETLDTFNQQNLALTLWAYARFAFCPNPAIMAACTERATELAVVRPAFFRCSGVVVLAVVCMILMK